MAADDIAVLQGLRLKKAREEAGFSSAREAALAHRWPESSYRAHEAGKRTIGLDDANRYVTAFRARGAKVTARDVLFPTVENHEPSPDSRAVRIMGYVGAGAQIEPEFEQIPAEGLDQVDARLPLPAEMVGFQVRGDSMTPRYDEGDVIVCFSEQRRALETFFNEEAAVRTEGGQRYLKRIAPGPTKRTVNLESFNAKTIPAVRLEWIGEIWLTLRAGQYGRLKRVASKPRSGRG